MRHVGIFLFEPRDLGLHELVEARQLLLASARLFYRYRRAGPSEIQPENKRTRVDALLDLVFLDASAPAWVLVVTTITVG